MRTHAHTFTKRTCTLETAHTKVSIVSSCRKAVTLTQLVFYIEQLMLPWFLVYLDLCTCHQSMILALIYLAMLSGEIF